MKVVCIVQARMGSKRLPGKVLLPLNGHTVIGEVLSRCKRIPGVDEVVCAISPKPDCEPLYREALKYGDAALVSVGDENDVLARYAAVARTRNADIVMRVTGDCPLICPEICGAVLALFEREKADYGSNIEPRTFPKGMDCEVMTIDMLLTAHRIANAPSDREHVTTWIRRQDHYNRVNLTSPWPMDGRLCLDTEDDYKVICAAFGHEPHQHLRAA